MPHHLTLNILLASAALLHVALAVILMRQYLRTRDIGLVWLGAAVVIWPVVSRLLDAGERISIARAVNRESVIYPFTLVASGQMTSGALVASVAVSEELVGVCLLLVAVLYLSGMKNRTPKTVASAIQGI